MKRKTVLRKLLAFPARISWSACLTAACVLAGALSLSGGSVLAAASESSHPVLAFAARVAGDEQRTRIVIDFDRRPDVTVHYVSNPDRIVVDLPGTAIGLAPGDLTPRGLLKDLRYGTMSAGNSRLVLTPTAPAKLLTSEVTAGDNGKGFRLVLDAVKASKAEFDGLVKSTAWQEKDDKAPLAVVPAGALGSEAGKFVVAIDAGHGGIDTGAVGQSGLVEKTVTLGFARTLAEVLKKQDGIEVVLTRSDDTYLSLQDRVDIAREHGAKLFISFHADKLKQADIRGATVYTISDTASDKLAASVAERENFSDELAGVAPVTDKSVLTDILLDLTRRETQAFSEDFAQKVVSSFSGQVDLINNPHRYAGFRVLRAADVPSILIELGFLSNKDDEKQLQDQKYRDKIAGLLAGTIKDYQARLIAKEP